MPLSDSDEQFIRQRERLLKYWAPVGIVLVLSLIALVTWFWLQQPQMISPFAISKALEKETLPESSLRTLAFLMPISMMMALSLAAFLIAFAFIAFGNERKHIAIIRRLQQPSSDS